MGYKIAEEALRKKHRVILISGPVNINPPKADKLIFIQTADNLLKELKREIKNADCLIMCAAVSDFRVKKTSAKKIKRKGQIKLKLIPNKDILKELARYKGHKLFIGFNLETSNLVKNAKLKLEDKNLDLIVANKLTKSHNPFGNNRLNITIIDTYNNITYINHKNKSFIAHVLLDKIEKLWYEIKKQRSLAAYTGV